MNPKSLLVFFPVGWLTGGIILTNLTVKEVAACVIAIAIGLYLRR